METAKKHKAAFLVSTAVNVGAVLFGFETGVAGGVVALGSFRAEFDLGAPGESRYYASASSNVVALLNLGAFLGALVPPVALALAMAGGGDGHITTRLAGRRPLLACAGLLFVLGGVLQVAASGPGLGMVYGGRVVAGLGVGMVSNVAPVFVAECAPKHLRGIMMSLFEMFLVSGGMLAYWTVYGCSLHLPATNAQWRVPLSLQIVLAAIVVVLSFLVPESPRWLAKQNRYDEATRNLCYLRSAAVDSEEVAVEVAEIRAQIDQELAIAKGRTVAELTKRHNFIRLLWALGIGLFSMWCGHNAILYYGPAVFAEIGYTTQNAALLASGVFTCIKFASTVVFILGGVHFFKRKTLLAGGSLLMGVFLFTLGGILSTHPPTAADNGAGSPSSRGMMALIYLFVVAYSLSWGPLVWVYTGEIFPTRIRDHGMAISAANVWLWNFVVSKITPIAIVSIGWKTWMVFGSLNAVAALLVLLLPETKDLSLEGMDVLFGLVDESTRHQDIESKVDTHQLRKEGTGCVDRGSTPVNQGKV